MAIISTYQRSMPYPATASQEDALIPYLIVAPIMADTINGYIVG